MTCKTIVLCASIILFFITVEHLRYLPKNTVIKKYFRSEFRGRNLANRKLFSDYLRRFKKSYEPEEFFKRFRQFKKNLNHIEKLNDGLNHATFGVTKFSDWSRKERFQMLAPQLSETCKGGEKAKNCTKTRRGDGVYRIDVNDGKTPLRWDWTEHDAVGPIFDQKRCPICWAASTAGVMESMAAINGLGFTTLSKQQLIDCTFDEGTEKTGCRHGRPLIDVFENMCNEHIKIATEARYPLTFADEDCKRVRGERGLARFEINCTMHKDEKRLVDAIARGPVTALVDARLLFNYLTGIISHHCKVTEADLNHAVQIVGYNTDSQPPYYIVKNSWGDDWGEKGYARFAIGGNQCGIAYSIGILDVY